MKYYVWYNCKLIEVYKSLKCALNLVRRKGWRADNDNTLWLVDSNGTTYNPHTGEMVYL